MARLIQLGDIATIAQGVNVPAEKGDFRARPHENLAKGQRVNVVSVGDVQDDRLVLENPTSIDFDRLARPEKHLLRPDDVLVSARSTIVKAALVPPSLARSVADATLLVVRGREPDLGPYLWWFLTSAVGRRRVLGQMKGSTTLLFLSAASLAEIDLPLPRAADLYRICDLVEASERAYVAATEAAGLRRAVFRDALVDQLGRSASSTGEVDAIIAR